ncbi:MAG: MTAP family purine nucleoside phosphorylase [Nitrososphaerota archaeon]|nr:MTAP family purine nucleoside phosphorylase [Nitrososphaerota archaeon]
MPAGRAKVGVITGSGMEELFGSSTERLVKTDYGVVKVYACTSGGKGFVVIPRHGREHSVPPHRVNFKANVQAMKVIGVRDVIATSAVGSISKKVGVGELGLLDQFIDLSKRHLTFFEKTPTHVDMTYPYDAALREMLSGAARSLGISVKPGLVYVCVDGPRYETAAEIRMFGLLGGDVVGMTGAPEAILSRELGLRYASVVVATNWAAGIQEKVSHDEVLRVMEKARPRLRSLLELAIAGR